MYYGYFKSEADVCEEFQIDNVDGVILFAAYEGEGYEGEAEVIFASGGKFYHVSGSHCSCYGLEDQWKPEEMPIAVLLHMATEGRGLLRHYRNQIVTALEVAENMHLDEVEPEVAKALLVLALK